MSIADAAVVTENLVKRFGRIRRRRQYILHRETR